MFDKFLRSNIKDLALYALDLILRKPNIKNGFIEESAKKTLGRGDFIFGAVNKIVLLKGGQWFSYRPTDEEQNIGGGSETMACVSFSACNCLEEIINFFLSRGDQATDEQKEIVRVFKAFNLIENGKANFSDRYVAKMSGTTIRGNSQQSVANAIRHYGLIPEIKHPYVNGWNNYYSSVPKELIDLGKKLTEYIDITYEWVDQSEFNNAKDFAPIQTSVYAWPSMNSEGIFQRVPYQLNHAVCNDGFVMNKYDMVYDTYDPFSKKVSWNFNFGRGMLYFIRLKKKYSNQEEVNKLIKKGLKYVMNVQGGGEVYELTSNGLLKISPKELNDDYIKILSSNKILVGISSELMNKLLL